MKPNRVIMCLGSNTADRADCLAFAMHALARYVTIKAYTPAYGCPSYNGIGASYANVVISAETTLDFEALTFATKQIEVLGGRVPDSKTTGVMPLDIDIVLWNDTITSHDDYQRKHFQIGYKMLNDNI